MLATYLQSHGWSITHETSSSAVWARQTDSRSDELGVPSEVRVGGFEWSEILRRIALSEGRPERALVLEFDYAMFDGVRFRIANDGFIDETVPLHSGVALVSAAYSMLRASATTAQRLRSHIGSAYSRVGDEYVQRARLAHTEQGSFVVPILFQHDEPIVPSNIEPIAGTERLTLESPQRRIVRTLAQTLETYKKRIIEPGKEVREGNLTSVIAAGGSRELFAGLEKVLYDPSVKEFSTSYSWGLSLPETGNAPASVAIPGEARELVRQTVSVLTRGQKQPTRIFTGPIVAFEHEPGDPILRIALQTPASNGRMSRVYMTVPVRMQTEILQWIRDNHTVTVQGVVERLPGRPLQLQGVATPMRLDDSFLSESGTSNEGVST
ncbi:hypothetical protein [Herbiconiux sp. VKM Ac-2851]|uniref:hypothetical protein n=1 Tax=Herbiconiux sp. VKM Ac-2851 TaxID=2739025 RepID=UPI001566F71D|nr:hypothetical protein [Herbiconiux sp. VKM Ac-2851]NQX37135.1 hypothetical protein [Herbiconiux sp. VKM Ac-2851]